MSGNISKKLLKEISQWLQAAPKKSKSSVSFGQNVWENMHGGGTSVWPHCRPQGLYNTAENQYFVRLVAATDKDNPDQKTTVVSGLEIKPATEGEEPSKSQVYAALKEQVDKS